jgi:hypothetical protein
LAEYWLKHLEYLRNGEWLMPNKCAVLVPVLSGIEPETHEKLGELQGRGYDVMILPGVGAIDFARSELASLALSKGHKELMWIDGDMGFEVDDVEKLRGHNLPFSCALYRKKGVVDFACQLLPTTKELVVGSEGGLTEIQLTGFGFVHTRAEVYDRIRRFYGMPACKRHGLETRVIPYFIPQCVKGHDGEDWYQNEDYSFCWRARECGFKVWADTTIKLYHIGKKRWSWDDMVETGSPSTIRFPVKT